MTKMQGQAGSRWDPHKHKDEMKVSVFNTVVHPEEGTLYQGDYVFGIGMVYQPIQFKDKASAWEWVREGTVARL